MRNLTLLLAVATSVFAAETPAPICSDPLPAPIRVLVVTGGCCHDYAAQHVIIEKGLLERANVKVTHAYSPSKGTDVTFDIFNQPNWGKDFDVVVHDECAADVKDKAYIEKILAAHRGGLPAVNLHCAMHSYRFGNYGQPVKAGADNAAWFEFLGLQSSGHGPQLPIEITYVDTTSPASVGLPNWTTGNEELYNNVAILTGHVLAKGKQVQKGKDGKPDKVTEAVVVWTNTYGPKNTRIFSTTLAHNNATVQDPRYLDLVTRGVLWTTGRLGPDGKAAPGYGR